MTLAQPSGVLPAVAQEVSSLAALTGAHVSVAVSWTEGKGGNPSAGASRRPSSHGDVGHSSGVQGPARRDTVRGTSASSGARPRPVRELFVRARRRVVARRPGAHRPAPATAAPLPPAHKTHPMILIRRRCREGILPLT